MKEGYMQTGNVSHSFTTRQRDIIPEHTLTKRVNIIGCGAIGSFTALALAKMGMKNITVWDMDSVSDVNMNNQFFRYTDIGTNKALALKNLIKDFTGEDIIAHDRMFHTADLEGMQGLLVVAVDSMDTRAAILQSIKKCYSHKLELLIDPRMGAEEYMQFVTKLDSTTSYEKTLYSSKDVEAPRCTAKSTIYTATLAAGTIAKTVKAHLVGAPVAKTTLWEITKLGNTSLQQYELTQ